MAPAPRTRRARPSRSAPAAASTPGPPRPTPESRHADELIADTAHELRTPLTSIMANLELLGRNARAQDAKTLAAALTAAHRMRRLLDDLLMMARTDGANARPPHRVDLADVVTDAVNELGPRTRTHPIRLDARPADVTGYRDDLDRLVLNLVDNALIHTPEGTHIHLRTHTRGTDAVIVVADDGPGVPPELHDRVFDRFTSGHGGPGRSGLGLAIARSIARHHDGTLTLDPPEGAHGATFTVTIPRA